MKSRTIKKGENSINQKIRMIAGKITLFVMAITMAATTGIILSAPQTVYADSASVNNANLMNRDPSATINDKDRESAYILIIEYMDSLKVLYNLSDAAIQRMDAVFYQANVYIATSHMTVGELIAYVDTVKANLATAAGNPSLPSETSSFLFLVNEVPTASVRYGQSTTLQLSLVNLAKETVTDVVVTPKISTKVSEWPFVITNASDVRMISSIAAGTTVEDAYAKRQDLSWTYTVANDALSGTYPLTFHVQYYRNGNIEEADLVTYINITGKSGNGSLENEEEDDNKTSTPRIIVTGFSTDPGEVYAGDTFNLTITIQNTSTETDVSNIQFDLKAAQVGNSDSTYEAFLPTSGSATIYVDKIAAGASRDISIEMTARNDLSQKPYVITVEAEYEDKNYNAYTASTNVSIPVKQYARVDTGAEEIVPESIPVGGSSNVMFSIYNMGKTTLYNVQVTFEGETVSSGMTFIGKIEPEGTGNVDVMVDGIMPTQDDGIITAVISYEDELGNVSVIEKELTLFVYEEYYEDYGDDFYYDDFGYEDVNQGAPVGMIVGIIAGVVVVIVVVIIIVVNVKKKKKKAQELKELENDIDEE